MSSLIKTGLTVGGTAAGAAVGGPVGASIGAGVGNAVGSAATGSNLYESIGSGVKTGAGETAGGVFKPDESKAKSLATALGFGNIRDASKTIGGALSGLTSGDAQQQEEQRLMSLFASNPSLLDKLMRY